MKKTAKKNDNPLLSIRFIGPDLKKNAMPIYELGSTLISLQRILHKAYLFRENRLEKGARLSFSERRELALRISETKEGSDEYSLMTFLTDPVVIDHIKTLIVDGLVAISAYTLGRVFPRKKSDKTNNQILIAAIYNEVSSVSDRIENISGVKSIQIFPGTDLKAPKITFNLETQEYVRQVQHETLYGGKQNVTGYITKMYPNRFIVDIKVSPNYYAKIHLSPEDFDLLRYETRPGQIIGFFGRPVYKFGQITQRIKEFEATKVTPTDEVDDNFEI